MWRSFAWLLVALAAPGIAVAEYPEKPIRMIAAFPAGGSSDLVARSLAEKMKDLMGQPMIVENRPGATGNIAAEAVVRSAPDGYTILFHTSALVINPWLAKPTFDVRKDLQPVIRPAFTPYVLVAKPDLPVNSVAELEAYARRNPGKLSCSSYGLGSPPHLALELFKMAANVDIVHVPYKVFAQAIPDLLSGQLHCGIDTPTNVLPHVRSGKVKAIAQTGAADHVMEVLPQAEPLAKRYPDVVVIGWQGIFAPAGTPGPIVKRLNAEFGKVIRSPDFVKRLKGIGFEPLADSVDEFSSAVERDLQMYGRIIQAKNIKP